jgi:hypothetical protein
MILDRGPVHRGERCVQPHQPHFSINEPQADRCVRVQRIQQRGKFGGFALRMFQRSVDALVLLIAHDFQSTAQPCFRWHPRCAAGSQSAACGSSLSSRERAKFASLIRVGFDA